MLKTKRKRSSARDESQTVNFRTRNAQVKREKMLARLLSATMSVCADPGRRGNAVIDDVVRAAGGSPGAFYWYFDTLHHPIRTLCRRMAHEVRAANLNLVRSPP